MVNKRLSKGRQVRATGTALLLASTALAGTAAGTEIYRWVDTEGTVHFGDRPPANRPVVQIEVQPPMGGLPLIEDPEAVLRHPVRPEAAIEPGDETTAE